MYINLHYFLKFTLLSDTHLQQYIHLLVTGGGGGGGGHVTRKPDLVACKQQRHRPGCAFMQSDPHRCYSLNANVYNIQIGFMKVHMEYRDHKVASLGDLQVRDDISTLNLFKDIVRFSPHI